MMTQETNQRNNNFDFLRFLAASAVIVSHNFAIFGLKEPGLYSYNTLGGIGVSIFFLMSGFLITKSWIEKPQFINFLKKRSLRIFPALFFITLFCSFVLGPLVTTLDITEYFKNGQTWSYIKNLFLYALQFNLPGVFQNNPIPNVVNGPLWTLPIEFLMYFSIGIIGFFGLIKKKIIVPIIIISLLILNVWISFNSDFSNLVVFYLPLIVELKLPLFFFIGSFFYIYSKKILLDKKIAIIALTLFIPSLITPYANFIGYITIPYLIFFFAFKGPFFLRNFGKYGDFSYGMYIYAWPIQQTLVYLFLDKISFLIFFIAVFIITIFFAVISWYFIENPALSLKNRKLIS